MATTTKDEGSPGRPGRDFAGRVVAFVQSVPPGRVTTYGDVALAVGRPGAARAVGRVMASAPSGTPCHRVVRSDGLVAACEGPRMAKRLRQEGVAVRGGRLVDLAGVRWP